MPATRHATTAVDTVSMVQACAVSLLVELAAKRQSTVEVQAWMEMVLLTHGAQMWQQRSVTNILWNGEVHTCCACSNRDSCQALAAASFPAC